MSLFSRRNTSLEIMDDLTCKGTKVDQALNELDIINRWLGGNSLTVGGVAEMLLGRAGQSFTLCDLGCGSGEMLRKIHIWSKAQGIRMELTGLDANAYTAAFAKNRCADLDRITIKTADALSEEFNAYDLITATLFLHHLTDDQLIGAIARWQSKARIGIVINDLHRHPLAYYAIQLLTWLFSGSAMVKSDGPLSVLRGFTRAEWVHILSEAGISEYRIRWKWAFRWQILIPGTVA